MNKKNFIVVLIISVFIFFVTGQETELSQYYLKSSYDYINNGKFELAKLNLEKSINLNEKIPDAYYISNLLLPDTKENMHLKKNNANLIIKYFNNAYFIEGYYFYKQLSRVFENIKDFDKSIFYYDRLISILNRVNEEDYLNYLNMLFKSREKVKLDLIPKVVNLAKEKYHSLDFDFYLLLYKLNTGNINSGEFGRIIGMLEANNYSKERLIYVKALYYVDARILNNLHDEYINHQKNNIVELNYTNKILFVFLNKANYFSNQKIINLLFEWDKTAQNNLKTLDLINNKKINPLIKNNAELMNKYLNYTGFRTRDDDYDNNWEENYEFKNGVITNKILDANQDGIYESAISYYGDKIIDTYVIFGESNNDFKKFYFNYIDQTLKQIEFYSNNKLDKRVTLVQSLFKPEIKSLANFDYNSVIKNIAYIEEWNKDYIKINYQNSNIEEKYVDTDNNGKFDKKVYLKNGINDIVYNDINENGIYELYEKYSSGNLMFIEYMTDENDGRYDYREEYNKNGTVKYWDYDKNGIFEVAIEEDKSGITKKMFDINFNGKYDYIYEEKNAVLQKINKIDDRSNKVIKEIPVKRQYQDISGSKNWIIVTVKDPDIVKIPDEITISDKVKYSGIFYFNKEKIFFKNGIIENKYFSYRLFLLNNIIYLIELY